MWKVARYTSAAPMYFTEFENYVDGGVLANNPCDEGLIKVRSHYRHLGARTAVSCVVSIGCGVCPTSDMLHHSTCGVAGSTVLFSVSGRNPVSDCITVSQKPHTYLSMPHPSLFVLAYMYSLLPLPLIF